MALLTTLRIIAKNASKQNLKQQLITKRFSHGHRMNIEPSSFVWNQFKDYLHFYFMIPAIPLTLITAYANIFVGDAELTEIPEGYVPHNYEYYKHPITRFLVKYFMDDEVLSYENTVSKMAEESEKIILSKLRKQLKMMMAQTADNKAWYTNEIDSARNRWVIEMFNTHLFHREGIDDNGDKLD